MSNDWSEPFELAEFLVEPAHNRITRLSDHSARTLEPRVMDLLCELARVRGDVLSRHALLETIWKDEDAADERLTRAVHELRKALGDTKRPPRLVVTVPKRGYKLIAPANTHAAEQQDAAAVAPMAAKRTVSLVGLIALGVLFASLSAAYYLSVT